jgi:gluconokinase
MIVLVMGVAGSGKSLIGKMLSEALGCEFADADDFHSPANIDKMRRGIPLSDADRQPWLGALNREITQRLRSGNSLVLACSALKQIYRDQLAHGCDLKVVYLKGGSDVIYRRLAERKNHYMSKEMLASQFADLEEPADAIVVDVSSAPEKMVAEIRKKLSETAWTQRKIEASSTNHRSG